ncbi:MAG: preprotein translocase subunit SecG [Euzebya sp.]
MTPIIVILHILVSVLLILFILLKSGKGGGLSDMFGGGSVGSGGGSTIAEKNLDRLTVITAVVFAMTTVVLALRLVS